MSNPKKIQSLCGKYSKLCLKSKIETDIVLAEFQNAISDFNKADKEEKINCISQIQADETMFLINKTKSLHNAIHGEMKAVSRILRDYCIEVNMMLPYEHYSKYICEESIRAILNSLKKNYLIKWDKIREIELVIKEENNLLTTLDTEILFDSIKDCWGVYMITIKKIEYNSDKSSIGFRFLIKEDNEENNL